MQSELTEISQTVSNSSTDDSSNSIQYGIQAPHLLPDDPASSHKEQHGKFTGEVPVAANQGLPLRRDETADKLPRLSASPERNRTKPSYQNIAEYENALASGSPKIQNEGPVFKVIWKKGSAHNGPQLDEFPNGMQMYSEILQKS
jgi:hypothetical protein